MVCDKNEYILLASEWYMIKTFLFIVKDLSVNLFHFGGTEA